MNGSQDHRERRLAELKREVTRRGFDRHASLLHHVSELPPDLQSPALTADDEIKTIIVFPPQIRRGWDYVPKQALLFTPTGIIHIMASIWANQEPGITSLKARDLIYVKVTLVLLYGLLEIAARGPESPIRLNVEFNTVAWYYLSQPLRQLLHEVKVTSDTPKDKAADPSTVPRDLEALPLKFSNGVEFYGLLPGEQLEGLVFQPSLRKRWLFLFRRNIIANTLLLLSTNYVAVIQEDLNVEQGWVICYIPRDRITGMQSRPCDLGNELIVQLKREDQTAEHKILLKHEALESWREKWIQRGGSWMDLSDQT